MDQRGIGRVAPGGVRLGGICCLDLFETCGGIRDLGNGGLFHPLDPAGYGNNGIYPANTYKDPLFVADGDLRSSRGIFLSLTGLLFSESVLLFGRKKDRKGFPVVLFQQSQDAKEGKMGKVADLTEKDFAGAVASGTVLVDF